MVKKFLWGIALGILSMLMAILFAMTQMRHISPQMFQSKIHTIVHQKTKQSMIVDGDAHWSLFPWLGFVVHDVHLTNNNPDYTFEVTAPQIEVHISPLSLLLGHISIQTVRLMQPQATIQLHQPNLKYSPLFSAFSLFPQEIAAQFDLFNSPNLTLASGFNLDILQGKLTASTQSRRAELANFNAHANHIQDQSPYSLSFQGDYKDLNDHGARQPIHFSTLIQPAEKSGYIFNNTHLVIDYTSPGHTTSTWQLNSDINLAHDLSHLQLEHLVISAAEFRAQGHLSIEGDLSHMHGQLSIPSFHCQTVLKDFDLGVAIQDQNHFHACQGDMQITPSAIAFHANIDNTVAQGIYHMHHLANITNKIHLDTLDLQPYLPPTLLPATPMLHPLYMLFDTFDTVDIDTIQFGPLTGHQQHCEKQNHTHHCHMDAFLGGHLETELKPHSNPDLGWEIDLHTQNAELGPLIDWLPNRHFFSLMGQFEGHLNLRFTPQETLNAPSLYYRGQVSATAIKTQGFSLHDQLMPHKSDASFLSTHADTSALYHLGHMQFSGVNHALSVEALTLSNTRSQTTANGFVDLNSGALSFKLNMHNLQPNQPHGTYRLLGIWPNALKLIQDLPLS